MRPESPWYFDWTDLKWSSGCFSGMGLVAMDTHMTVAIIEFTIGAALYISNWKLREAK